MGSLMASLRCSFQIFFFSPFDLRCRKDTPKDSTENVKCQILYSGYPKQLEFVGKRKKKLSVRCFLNMNSFHLLLFFQVTDRNDERPET